MTTEPKPVLTVPLARMLLVLSMDESDYMTRIVLRSAANVIETLVVERKELLAARDNAPVHVPAPEPRATPGRDAPPAGAAREPASSVAPDAPPASWVVRERTTGRVVMETFDRRVVEALNTERYEAVPIGQHLAEVNRAINNMQVLLKALVNQGEKR